MFKEKKKKQIYPAGVAEWKNAGRMDLLSSLSNMGGRKEGGRYGGGGINRLVLGSRTRRPLGEGGGGLEGA